MIASIASNARVMHYTRYACWENAFPKPLVQFLRNWRRILRTLKHKFTHRYLYLFKIRTLHSCLQRKRLLFSSSIKSPCISFWTCIYSAYRLFHFLSLNSAHSNLHSLIHRNMLCASETRNRLSRSAYWDYDISSNLSLLMLWRTLLQKATKLRAISLSSVPCKLYSHLTWNNCFPLSFYISLFRV